MTRPAVVDTNVIIAGLLTGTTESPVARILDGMLEATFPFALSDALLAEYGQVLLRPALRRCHGLDDAEVETLLVHLALNGMVLVPIDAGPVAPDPGDQHLWDLLAIRDDLVLVTGDKRLFADAAMRGRLVSPREFVDPMVP